VNVLTRKLARLLGAVALMAPCSVWGQDTVPTGVRLGLTFSSNGKAGITIPAVPGANGDSVRRILARDLDFSDRFNVIELDSAATGALNYELHARLGAVAVLQASVTPTGTLHAAVHDVGAKRVIAVMDIALPAPALSSEWRAVVHAVADSSEWAITGQRGIAGTRIAYMRQNQIWLVDFDGAVARPVSGTENAMSPAWHPSGSKLAYNLLPVGRDRSRVVVRDLETGPVRTISVSDLNQSPVFSPDGRELLLSAGPESTDLYAVDLVGSQPTRRVTSRRGSSNMSPTVSPDGRRIAFTSDLIGHPEVYIVDADGSGAEPLVTTGFGDRPYRANPDWSPDGRRIAFQSRINDVFQVFASTLRDRSIQQLTSDGENESPSWAPDGRHIVLVSSRSGARELWVLDTETFRTRQLTRGTRVGNPAWSPRLMLTTTP